jgi:parallel beta-helix repeat protein
LRGGINLYVPDDTLQYVIFDNLTVDGTGIFVGGAGVRHIKFQNSEIKNSPGNGISGWGGPTHIEFFNLKVYNNGSSKWDHGFYVAMQYTLIDTCDIYNNSGYGIQVYDGGCTTNDCADNTTIRNSQIHDNHGDGGVTLNHGSNIVFEHNFVYNNDVNGVEVSYGDPDNTRIIGNTIYNNQWGGININSGRNATVQDNHLSGNRGAIADHGAGTTLRANSIE